MTSVLVVDDDQQLVSAISRDLRANGYDVLSASSVDGALEQLEERVSDVVLTDLRMAEADGIDLLLAIRERGLNSRPILMSAYATARDHQKAVELGAVRVLCKPFGSRELLDAIQQAIDCATGFRGSVHGLSLIDMLQMFHYGRRSITLRVDDAVAGQIHFEDGEIVHAEHGETTGEEALKAILAMPTGSLSTGAFQRGNTTIERSFQSLLLDLLRTVDEQQRDDAEFDLGEADFFGAGFEGEDEGDAMMGKIDDACKEVVNNVDGAVACGVVDLDTGMLLGIHNTAQYTQTLNEVVAAATMDLFRGPNVGRIEQMVRAHRGLPEDGEHYFQEVHIASAHNYHFAKTMKGGKAVIMLVTKKTTNVGLGWAELRAALPKVEPLVP
ncbi:MAG: response regulator [Polyangiaceae bacterium]